MKTRTLKWIGAIFESILSTPILGLIVILSPIFSIAALLLHAITLIMSSKEESTILGNVFGFIASAIMLATWMMQDIQIWSLYEGIILFVLVLSWPLHILSTIFIFRGMSQDKQKSEGIHHQAPAIHHDSLAGNLLVRSDLTKEGEQFQQVNASSLGLTRERELKQEKDKLVKHIRFIMEKTEQGMKFGLDTSFLTRTFNDTMLRYLFEREGMTLYISAEVMDELVKIKEKGKSLGRAATDALALIEQYKERAHIVFVPKVALESPESSLNEKDRMIRSYVKEQGKHDGKFLLLTEDATTKMRANDVGLQVAQF